MVKETERVDRQNGGGGGERGEREIIIYDR